MNRTIVDANVILRYLLDDNELLARKAARILEDQSTLAPLEVICEVVYVLEGVYRVGRQEIYEALVQLFDRVDIISSCTGVLFEGLSAYRKTSLDFVDCLLIGYRRVENYTVETFDKRLQKQLKL
jgi:predicted nucleic-acid-binding protein